MRRKSDSGLHLSDFVLQDEIGRGGFGTVHKALWKSKNAEVAIKKITSKTPRNRLLSEVESHGDAEHDNIVKFYGHFSDGNVWYIVMELCKEGSLRNYLRDGSIREIHVRKVMRQIVRALEYLHGKGLVHRDLTAGNVLITRVRSSGELNIKLCDFGLAKVMKGRGAHTVAGTPGYMAPQVANREKYGSDADVYSLGCVLYAMLTGKEPEADGTFPKLNQLSKEAADLIRNLTADDLQQRISLEDILSSDFMVDRPDRSKSRERKSHDARLSSTSVNQSLSVDENRKRSSLSDRKHTLKDRNAMPYASSRRDSSVSKPQPITNPGSFARSNGSWPLRIERLSGKQSCRGNYSLSVVEGEAVLKKDDNEVLRVRVEGSQQHLGIFSCRHARNGRPCTTCSRDYSLRNMPSSTHNLYEIAIDLVEEIRWKTAKMIFDRCTMFPEGIIRLMENGDLRLHDLNENRKFGVKAGSDQVLEGDFRHPSFIVSNSILVDKVRKIKTFMEGTERILENINERFPFQGGNFSPAQGQSADYRSKDGPQSDTRTGRQPRIEKTIPSRLPSRTHSAHSSRSIQPALMSRFSEPDAKSVAGEEKIKYYRVRRGKQVIVQDNKGRSIRESTATPGQYIVTGIDGKEKRFTMSTGLPISTEIRPILQKLMEAKKQAET